MQKMSALLLMILKIFEVFLPLKPMLKVWALNAWYPMDLYLYKLESSRPYDAFAKYDCLTTAGGHVKKFC